MSQWLESGGSLRPESSRRGTAQASRGRPISRAHGDIESAQEGSGNWTGPDLPSPEIWVLITSLPSSVQVNASHPNSGSMVHGWSFTSDRTALDHVPARQLVSVAGSRDERRQGCPH